MKRPYIPAGCDQQGRLQVPAVIRRAQAAAAQAVAAHVIADDPLDGPANAPTRPRAVVPKQPAPGVCVPVGGDPLLLLACVIVMTLLLFALGGCSTTPPAPARPTCPPLLMFGKDQPLTGALSIYAHCNQGSLVVYDPQTEGVERVHGIGVGSRSMPPAKPQAPQEPQHHE